jgi:hypothetical protein
MSTEGPAGPERPPTAADPESHAVSWTGDDTEASRRRPYRPPAWVFPLGLVAALEPPVLIIVYFINPDLAGGHLLLYAFAGGFFITLPSLAILGLAVLWHKRLTMSGETIEGIPEQFTAPAASRASAIALIASTLIFWVLLTVLVGPWSLLALPPVAVSLASGWLMNEGARARSDVLGS